VFLATPTLILIIDNNADVSVFYSNAAPEEEEKGQSVSKDKDVVYNTTSKTDALGDSGKNEITLEYYFKNYQKPHLNLISPPPELYNL